MKAEIIASGTELLLGEITDINTPFIANQLATLGIDLYYVSIVGDNHERFMGVLRQAFSRSDITIITGGLGPTRGDITREVIAGLLGEEMAIDPGLKEQITGYFARLNLEMPENNLRQATLIPSATALPNPLGSAPGWWVEKSGRIIISLPGPPGEMQPMWEREVIPRLEKKGEAVIVSRTLKTWGLSEARIDQMVGRFMSESNPTLALYAKQDGIHLRITAKAASQEEAARLITHRESEIRELLKDHIWGADKDTLEGAVNQLLLEKGLTLAVAESVTGGLLSYTISCLPGSQEFFKGGITAANRKSGTESRLLCDCEEEASLNSATRMAIAVRQKFGADIGIGIDGYIRAENGAAAGKAFIAISMSQGGQDITQAYPAGSYQLVRRSVMHAFFLLRKMLLGMGQES
jgi:nicotinamide-nucleotide amidase